MVAKKQLTIPIVVATPKLDRPGNGLEIIVPKPMPVVIVVSRIALPTEAETIFKDPFPSLMYL